MLSDLLFAVLFLCGNLGVNVKSSATINFELSLNAEVAVILYDLSGKELRDYRSFANILAGKQQLTLNLNSLESGMYLCKILVNEEVVTLKLIK